MQAGWLTAPRTARLLGILTALPRPDGMDASSARLTLWRSVGGPIDEIAPALEVLTTLELVQPQAGRMRLTPAGTRLLAQSRTQGYRPLAITLIRSGMMSEQARVLLDLSETTDDGSLVCALRRAQQGCPQLLGLLAHWPDVETRPQVRIPAGLVQELQAVWALMPVDRSDAARREKLRQDIGNRGELYTYQLERIRATNPSHIVWVARDDDRLGYDVEDRSVTPRRRIEAKASGATPVVFFLSENEWNKAHDDPQTYEIQFWGDIDLNREPATEFAELRQRGYPKVYMDVPSRLANGELTANPIKWRVSAPAP